MYWSQSVLALQEWSWWDWYGVWTGGVSVGDFRCGAGEGVLRGVVGVVREGEVGGVQGVHRIKCEIGRDKSLGLIVVSSDRGATCRNSGILTVGLRRCCPARGHCRSPVEKELSDLKWQVGPRDSRERCRGVIVRHMGWAVVFVCFDYPSFYVCYRVGVFPSELR